VVRRWRRKRHLRFRILLIDGDLVDRKSPPSSCRKKVAAGGFGKEKTCDPATDGASLMGSSYSPLLSGLIVRDRVGNFGAMVEMGSAQFLWTERFTVTVSVVIAFFFNCFVYVYCFTSKK
jgi:hypothetical protein